MQGEEDGFIHRAAPVFLLQIFDMQRQSVVSGAKRRITEIMSGVEGNQVFYYQSVWFLFSHSLLSAWLQHSVDFFF
jgi:hypothetical protein